MIDASEIKRQFDLELEAREPLPELKVKYLGRKQGILTDAFSEFAKLDVEQKRLIGPKLQELKKYLEEKLGGGVSEDVTNSNETIAFTNISHKLGHLHPITQTVRQMNAFFKRLGFSVYDGPEVETDEFNFQRLNVPVGHVARDMQDTIYIDAPNILLRTQTSSIEARALAELKPPFRIVSPAKVYRNEKASRTNHFIFHQYQCVVVDENVTMSDLFGTLKLLFEEMYGKDVVMRFRSKYYPEVEPGVGPDLRCFSCKGKGCAVCKGRGWIEMAGAGMIHEKMLKMAGIDTKKYNGFAFGLGLDRWVMAKYNITDIRTLLGGKVIYPYFENESTL